MALNEAEKESVVKLACEVMAEEVAKGPVMTAEDVAAGYVQLKTGRREREVFGCPGRGGARSGRSAAEDGCERGGCR